MKLLLLDCDSLREGADKAIAHYSSDEWTIIGITNALALAADRQSLSDCFDEQRCLLKLFPQIAAIYFPDEENECWVVDQFSIPLSASSLGYEGKEFRKPGPGMLKLAMWQYSIAPQHTFYVGDRPEDEQAATRAGVHFMPADIWLERFRTGVYKVN